MSSAVFRWTLTTLLTTAVVGIPVAHELAGWPGVFTHMVFVYPLPFVLDWLWSPEHQLNLQTLAANGFSRNYVLFTIISQGIGSTMLVAGVKHAFAGRFSQGDFPEFEWFSLVVVLVNLVLAEVAFTAGHSMLHLVPALAPLHVMHHSCVKATVSTNLIFDPIDLSR